jgi:hypothetical protein
MTASQQGGFAAQAGNEVQVGTFTVGFEHPKHEFCHRVMRQTIVLLNEPQLLYRRGKQHVLRFPH